jgi:hypothetical protein
MTDGPEKSAPKPITQDLKDFLYFKFLTLIKRTLKRKLWTFTFELSTQFV